MSKGVPTVRTDEAREKFLQALTSACNVTAACKAAGIGRQTAYQWREDDPSGSNGTTGDIQGIVVAGVDKQGQGYVLADCSCRLSPDGWARVVANAAEKYGADRVVAERNFGGAMVEAVLKSAAPKMPVKLVTASRGKVVRAEPIAAYYEQGKVHHVGTFPDLEDQLTMTTTTGFQGGGSPDRMDALVWALTELMGASRGYDLRAIIGTDEEIAAAGRASMMFGGYGGYYPQF